MDDRAVAELVRDPDWLPHRYDPGHDAIHFVRVDRAARARATFATETHLGPLGPAAIIARRSARSALGRTSSPLHFVFHSAFCCSTLVARALDRPGWASALKEPVILNDLIGWRRRGATVAQLRPVLDDVLALLARPFAEQEAMIVKPSNTCNALIDEIFALRPHAHALLLHAPLRTFVTSVAKKGIDGRLWVRELFLGLLRDGLVRFDFDQDQLFGQTDLQIAAMGWLAQHALFDRLASTRGDRVRTLSSETLLARPLDAMTALAGLFGLSDEARLIAEVASGPAFSRHSKDDRRFDATARAAEYADAASQHQDEIEKVVLWANAVAEHHAVAPVPVAPLIH